MAAPCYRLLESQSVPQNWIRKNGSVHPKYPLPWEPEQIESFEALKKATGQALELPQPDFNDNFILETDASEKAYGGHIYQLKK